MAANKPLGPSLLLNFIFTDKSGEAENEISKPLRDACKKRDSRNLLHESQLSSEILWD